MVCLRYVNVNTLHKGDDDDAYNVLQIRDDGVAGMCGMPAG
jgi:hypothetical protein